MLRDTTRIGRTPLESTFTGDQFKDCYIARGGRQRWMTGDTWGGRYLALTVRSGKVVLHDFVAVDRTYPFTRPSRFRCGDPVLEKIWDIGVTTVEVCSEDAHVDCADRERAQWMADGFMMGWPVSRVALAGPGEGGLRYADGRLLANMLRHVAFSQLPDGRLQPMRPSEYPPNLKHGVIDDYSCLWVQAVRDLYDTRGHESLLRELWPTVITSMDYFLRRRTERGLVNGMEFVYFNNPLAYEVCEGTTLNCYVHRSLEDAAYLGGIMGDHATADRFMQAADNLARAINTHLWDETAGSYHGGILDGQQDPINRPRGPAGTVLRRRASQSPSAGRCLHERTLGEGAGLPLYVSLSV